MKTLFVVSILMLTFHNSYYENKSNKIVNLDGNTYLIDNKYEKNLFSTKLGEKFSKFLINLDAKKTNSYDFFNTVGLFIDDEETLNINVTGEPYLEISKNFLNGIDNNLYKINLVKNSNNKLKKYKYLVEEKLKNYINGVYISNEKNTVVIHLNDNYDIKFIKDILGNDLDFSLLEFNFNQQKRKISPSNSTIKSGATIYNIDENSSGTIGFNAIDNTTRLKGIVTNAHVAGLSKLSKNYMANNVYFTEINAKKSFLENDDSAFIPFSDQKNVDLTANIVSTDSFYISNISDCFEGTKIWSVGSSTGSTYGEVISNDYTVYVKYTYSGEEKIIKKSNTIYYNNLKKKGDSGGPLFNWNNRLSKRYIYGIHFADDQKGNSYAININNVINNLNVSIYTK